MTDDQSLNRFCESLQSLQPARNELDVRHVFYAAGVQAARKQEGRVGFPAFMPFVAAVLAGVLLTAPLAYQLGQSNRGSLDSRVAEQTSEVTSDRSTESVVAENDDRPSDQADRIEAEAIDAPSSNRMRLASSFAGWLDLDEMVAAARLDRAAQPTLAAFHAALVRDPLMERSAEFPLPMIEDSVVLATPERTLEQADLLARPLAVGDRQRLFSNLEESR